MTDGKATAGRTSFRLQTSVAINIDAPVFSLVASCQRGASTPDDDQVISGRARRRRLRLVDVRRIPTLALVSVLVLACGQEAERVPERAVDPPADEEIPPPPPEDESPPDPCPHVADDVTIEPDRLLVDGDIGFDLYAPAINEDSWPIVEQVAERILHCDDVRIEVQVHTSSFGSSTFNARSSTALAQAIRARMIENGVPEDRVAACGYGEARPIADNMSQTGRAQNERVEWVRIADPAAHVCPSS